MNNVTAVAFINLHSGIRDRRASSVQNFLNCPMLLMMPPPHPLTCSSSLLCPPPPPPKPSCSLHLTAFINELPEPLLPPVAPCVLPCFSPAFSSFPQLFSLPLTAFSLSFSYSVSPRFALTTSLSSLFLTSVFPSLLLIVCFLPIHFAFVLPASHCVCPSSIRCSIMSSSFTS
jgi:hypothetical protein